jgi:hypothetical protein
VEDYEIVEDSCVKWRCCRNCRYYSAQNGKINLGNGNEFMKTESWVNSKYIPAFVRRD